MCFLLTTTTTSSTDEKDVGVTTVPTEGSYSSFYQEGIGDLQVLKVSEADNVKLAKDGITVLIPQPSDDPDDPVSRHSSLLCYFVYLTK